MRIWGLTLATAAAVSAAVLVPAGDDPASAAVTQPAAVRVPFSAGGTSWTPSSNARITKLKPASARTVQIRPKRSAGRQTISMRSSVSTDAVAAAGTSIDASALLRTTQPGRRLTLRVQEVKDGRVVSSRSTTVKPSSRGWRRVSATLRTTRPGSRIRVVAQAKRITGTHRVRLATLTVTATPPGRVSVPCGQIDYSDPAQGVRTFTENFDGNQIDRSTWRVRDDTFLNQDQAWITKDAVTVHDGYLDIAGRQLPPDAWLGNPHALYARNVIRDYSTGYVDTIDSAGYGNAAGDRFGQKYGHFEIRAWVPSAATMSRGIWPAFWLRADHQSGEIDPMESYGAPTTRSFDPSSSYEWNSWADTAQGSMTGIVKQMTQGRADVGTDKIWQGWHTFGVNWSPGCLRYLYDGRTVGLVDFDAPTTKPYFRGPTFDDTFHLRLNMQVGSNYWGWADPQHTRPEFSYKVDWVRVYQGKELLGG
ncbi:MAG: glycoside hydrolase family 16 protein [Aeromicrobium sp.]